MKAIVFAVVAVAALAGCSSFKMGGACYIPHGTTGTCTVDTTYNQPRP